MLKGGGLAGGAEAVVGGEEAEVGDVDFAVEVGVAE
jgi:hypothetical protein